MTADIGLHLGTRNLRVCHRKQKTIFSTPNIIARFKNGRDGNKFKFGDEAQAMLGKSHPGLELVRPVSGGTISSLTLLEEGLQNVFQSFLGNYKLLKPAIACSIPSQASNVEQRMLSSLLRNCGAQYVFLFPAPFLAGLSQNLPLFEPRGHLIVYVGAGFTDVAVLSLGGVVVRETVKVAGDDFNEAIIRGVRRLYDLVIGEVTAEEMKYQLELNVSDKSSVPLRGKDFTSGLPKEVFASPSDICVYLQEPLNAIVSCVKSVLSKTPPELLSDVVDEGLWLCGGTSKLGGFPELLQTETGLSVRVMESPEFSIIQGLLKLITDKTLMKISLRKSAGVAL